MEIRETEQSIENMESNAFLENNINIDQESNKDENQDISKTKWLIFNICGERYAVKEMEAWKILYNVDVNIFPFAPAFVVGVTYFHGKIYPVINYRKMIGDLSPNENANYYIIIKTDDGDFALKTDCIEDFCLLSDDDYYEINEENKDSLDKKNEENNRLNTRYDFCEELNYIKGYIDFQKMKIPTLDIDKINQRIIHCCIKENGYENINC